jgi:hypothetical protein
VNGAWADGAPQQPITPTGLPHGLPYQHDPGAPAPAGNPWPERSAATPRQSVVDRATARVGRVRQFEGIRGYSSRATLFLKYVNYFFLILLVCGVTSFATEGVRYATGGGMFMLFSCTTITVTGAVATLFYVNLRREIVERVRHYVFGIVLFPGALLGLLLRALQEWEWVNEGSLGTTLQAALPAIFLATVLLPAIVFVKEIVGVRTLHRSRLDDEEAVQLWTRQDGLQR